jgi:periplasmic protein TonB
MALLAAANADSLTVQSLQRRLARASEKARAEPVVAAVAFVPSATDAASELSESSAQVVKVSPSPSTPTTQAARPAKTSSAAGSVNLPVSESLSASQSIASGSAARVSTSSTKTEPVTLSKVSPVYPETAKKRRAEGWVELQFIVGTDGRASQIEVLRAQPEGMFDRSAVQAVTRWKFKPASLNGQPVEARATTKVGFKLG